jgi:hypothetical protein
MPEYCSPNLTTVAAWPTANGDELDMWVSYKYDTSDCSQLYLMTADVHGLTSPNADYVHDGT